MPRSKPCIGNHGPCPTRALTTDKTSRCNTCRSQLNIDRGSSTARGYNEAHRRLRKAYEPLVAAGQAYCWRCLARGATNAEAHIAPGTPWDLGHRPDRTHAGPEHQRCNRATNKKEL